MDYCPIKLGQVRTFYQRYCPDNTRPERLTTRHYFQYWDGNQWRGPIYSRRLLEQKLKELHHD